MQISIVDFVKRLTLFFNYSYERYDEYNNFCRDYISDMKKRIPLFSYDNYCKITKYCKVIFLSLGKSLSTILMQWVVFYLFSINNLKIEKH